MAQGAFLAQPPGQAGCRTLGLCWEQGSALGSPLGEHFWIRGLVMVKEGMLSFASCVLKGRRAACCRIPIGCPVFVEHTAASPSTYY